METSVFYSWKAESWGLRSSLSCNDNATPEKTEPSYLAIPLHNDGALVGKEWGFPRWLTGKESPAGDKGLIPGSGRSPGGGDNGNVLWYSCLEKCYGQPQSAGSQRVRRNLACMRFIYLDGDICDNPHEQLKSLCAPKHLQTAEISWIIPLNLSTPQNPPGYFHVKILHAPCLKKICKLML